MRKIDTRRFVRATRATPRNINRQILLNLVREQGPISRADLARRMDIGRGMVTALVDELLHEEAIYEGATVDAPRGRKPKMLYVRTRGRLVIGVDVRFSRTYLMLGDFAGVPVATESFETVTDPAAFVDTIVARVGALLRAHGERGALAACEGIGLVIPGQVDQLTGRVLNSPQLGWRDVDVRDAIAQRTGLATFVENAPIACALAHMWLGTQGAEQHDRLRVRDGERRRRRGDRRERSGRAGHRAHRRRVRPHPARARRRTLPLRRARLPRGLHVEPRDAQALPRPRPLAGATRATCCARAG